MNSKIRNLDLEKLLFFDAELVRASETLDIDSKEFELYQKKLRNKETGEYPESSVVQAHYNKNAGLDPTFNKVVSVVVGFIKGKTFFYKKLEGTQSEIVEAFYATVQETGLVPCGHNVIGFDLPTLRLKGFQSGVDISILPDKYNDSQKKPWNMSDAVVDTMEITKGTFFYNLGLDSLCYLTGIESPKNDIDGSQVSDVYYSEGIERISEYCVQDVLAVARVMCAIQGDKDRIQEVVERKATPVTPLLERIYISKEISDKDKEELRKLILIKKPSEEEIEIIRDMVTNLYIQSKMFEADSKEVVETKTKEVNELIEELCKKK
jgi:3'-5' exonuclease